MDFLRPELRDVLARLIRAVFDEFARRHGAPHVGPMQDLRHWRRCSQTSFVALRREAWHVPGDVWAGALLDTFDEMVLVRQVIEADPLIGSRVDNLVGTDFSKQQRRLGLLLFEHLLEPVVLASGAYRFDDDVFDVQYSRLESGLLATKIRMVEFIPLNGFISGLDEIEIADGLVLRPLTDSQTSAAIGVQGVPGEFAVGPNTFEVSWFNQWALVTEQSFAVRSGVDPRPEPPMPAPFPTLAQPATLLVQALRIVCGGSVISTRPIHLQHDEDFPIGLGASAALVPVGQVDLDRPTSLLDSKMIADVREVFGLLADPAVQGNRAVQTALRRLVASGSRNVVHDRLVDLMTCAESLFIKRTTSTRTYGKKQRIADGARELFEGDSTITAPGGDVVAFMLQAYELRNDEMHGDDPEEKVSTLLDGSEAHNLAAVVEDIERILRRAMHLILRTLP